MNDAATLGRSLHSLLADTIVLVRSLRSAAVDGGPHGHGLLHASALRRADAEAPGPGLQLEPPVPELQLEQPKVGGVEFREGLLTASTLVCFEVLAGDANSAWTIVAVGAGADRLLRHAPWYVCICTCVHVYICHLRMFSFVCM